MDVGEVWRCKTWLSRAGNFRMCQEPAWPSFGASRGSGLRNPFLRGMPPFDVFSQERLPELRELLDEILPLTSWKEIDKRFVAFRRRAKFVPKKNVLYHMYKEQEVGMGQRPSTREALHREHHHRIELGSHI